jgi:hypothetical protein
MVNLLKLIVLGLVFALLFNTAKHIRERNNAVSSDIRVSTSRTLA